MKALPVVGKFVSVVFAALIIAACSNTDTVNQDAAAAAAEASLKTGFHP